MLLLISIGAILYGCGGPPVYRGELFNCPVEFLPLLDSVAVTLISSDGRPAITRMMAIDQSGDENSGGSYTFQVKQDELLRVFALDQPRPSDSIEISFERVLDSTIIVYTDSAGSKVEVASAILKYSELRRMTCDKIQEFFPQLAQIKTFTFLTMDAKLRSPTVKVPMFEPDESNLNIRLQIVYNPGGWEVRCGEEGCSYFLNPDSTQ